MKPAKFNYYQPRTIDETLKLLANYGDEGKVLAGGQSFIPILNMRMSEVECLIDINNVKELDFIELDDELLKIGTLTRQRSLEDSEEVYKKVPLLRETCGYIGHRQTRNRGTVGGSVVHADPSAELPLVFLLLEGKVIVRSELEQREADLKEFFLTYMTTDMMPDELLTEIHLPIKDLPKGYAFEEISRRHGDFSLVSATSMVDCTETGEISRVKIAVGGVDHVPLLAEEEDLQPLIGTQLDENTVEDVTNTILEMAEPDGDLHATSEYRFHMAKVLIRKSLRKAYQRAQKEGELTNAAN